MPSKIIQFLAEKLVTQARFITLLERLFHYPSIDDNVEHVKRFKKEFHQSLLNKSVIPFHLKRIWPAWVYKQCLPKSPYFSLNENHLSLTNTSKRNWTVISAPKSKSKAVVDPNGLISKNLQSWSLDFWVSHNAKLVSPSYVHNIKQTFSTEPPSIQTNFNIDPLSIASEVMSTPFPDGNILLNAVTLNNTGDKALKLSFYFAIRPYNPLGISLINNINYLSQGTLMVNNKIGLVLDEKPDNIVCVSFKDGDVSEHSNDWAMILKSHCPDGLASAFVEYKLTLQAGQSKIFTCKIPETPNPYKNNAKDLSTRRKKHLNTDIQNIKTLSFENEKNHLSQHWTAYLPQKSTCVLPSTPLQSLFNKNITHLLSHVNTSFISSDTTSTTASYADSLTLIHALQTIGAYPLANELTVPLLIKKNWYQFPSEVQIPPSDIGRLLFLIKKSYQCMPDQSWIEKYFPQIDMMMTFISQSRISVRHKNHYMRGLISKQNPFPMSGQKDIYLLDTFLALSAVDSALYFATLLNKTLLITKYKYLQHQLNASLDLFCQHIEEKEAGKPLFPITEKNYSDSRLIDTLSCVYPLNIIEPHDTRVTHTLKQIDKHCIHENSVFTSTFPLGLDHSRSLQLAQIYAHRQDPIAHSILNEIVENSTYTGQWPSARHTHHNEGCSGEGQDGLSSANFLLLIRSLLLQEEDNEVLHITPCIPASWLEKNSPIALKNYPTQFGPISFSLHPLQTSVEFTFSENFHCPPKKIKLSLPVPIKNYTLNGKTQAHGSRTLIIQKNTGALSLYI